MFLFNFLDRHSLSCVFEVLWHPPVIESWLLSYDIQTSFAHSESSVKKLKTFPPALNKKKAKKSKQNNARLICMISWRLPKILVCCKLVMMFLGSFLLQLLFMGRGGVAEISRDKCLDPCFFCFFFPSLCPCKGILGVHMCVWRWSAQTCGVTTSWICQTYCGIEKAYLNYFCYCWLMLSTSMENRG